MWDIDCDKKETLKLSRLLDKCCHVLHPNMVFPKEHPGYVHSHHRNIARFLVLLQQKQTGNITLSQIDAITGTQWRRFLLSGPTGIPSAAPTTFEAWLLSGRRSPMSRALLDDIKNFESRRSPMSPALLEDIQNFDSQDLSRIVSPVTPVVQISLARPSAPIFDQVEHSCLGEEAKTLALALPSPSLCNATSVLQLSTVVDQLPATVSPVSTSPSATIPTVPSACNSTSLSRMTTSPTSPIAALYSDWGGATAGIVDGFDSPAQGTLMDPSRVLSQQAVEYPTTSRMVFCK